MKKLFVAALALLCTFLPITAGAYPDHPIRVIVPFSAGGSTDTGARIILEKMSSILKQPMVVENRPGALTQIGTRNLAEATPNGYTLGYLPDGALATMPAARKAKNLSALYDPTSLTPIGLGADSYFVLVVRSDLPIVSVNDLVGYAKERPGKFRFSSGNPSGVLLLAHLNRETRAGIVHLPYWKASEPDAVLAVLNGSAQGMFATTFSSQEHVKNGTLRAIGVPVESPFLLGTPSLLQQGLRGFEKLATWGGLFGPPGLSPDVVKRLNAALTRALIEPDVRERLEKQGLRARSSKPEVLGALVREQYEYLTQFIRENNIDLQ